MHRFNLLQQLTQKCHKPGIPGRDFTEDSGNSVQQQEKIVVTIKNQNSFCSCKTAVKRQGYYTVSQKNGPTLKRYSSKL